MKVKISEVTLNPSGDLIAGAFLDQPLPGPVDIYALKVVGWVVGKEPVAEVEFVHEFEVVARCQLTVSRPQAAELYGSSTPLVGFSKAIGTVGLTSAFTIQVRVVFQDGRRRQIAEICGTQQLTSAFTPSMQPIIVTNIGRSGGTMLMRMLAEHPDITVDERFPYESRVCSYWMHFIHVLAAPAEAEAPEFWSDPTRLAPFPYYLNPDGTDPVGPQAIDRWYGSGQVEEFARVAQAAVESFYREYASARTSATPAFFAEKGGVGHSYIRPIMRQLYPRGREIFLVRDPKDRLASVLAFNARRGYHHFGREQVDTDEQYVDVIRAQMVDLLESWKRSSHRGPLVRYEGLIRSPTEHIRAMLDALELDSSANIIAAMVRAENEVTADVNAHRTSLSSIGRGTQDLEPRLQKICDEAFRELLEELDRLDGSSY
ncbi:sulfotransferase [Mycobacterium sp. Marseille-P9652]|uniref:sulfotransferase n=1 Tax=Mycobacterium sp. Marseille-P9652 TaxID=2654950 RepID=UPI0012E87EB1|nr:sulfotransferase [Mycobacterium sp. Marseille-P9652]